jgi:hypothetical protein
MFQLAVHLMLAQKVSTVWLARLGKRTIVLMILLAGVGPAWSQDQPAAAELPPAQADAPAASDKLSIEQARLADRYRRLEEVVGRLAELSASNDPRRARLLREAIAQSREQDIHVRFESIVKLLESERLSVAATNQTELQKELDALLTLLLEADRDKELASERERVRKYLKEVSRLIRLQKGIRARTEGGDELPALSDDQERVAGETGKLGGTIEDTESDKKAPGSESPADNESSQSESKPSDGQSENSEGQPRPGDSPKPSEADQKSGTPPSGEPSDSESSDSQPGESKPSGGQSSPPQQGQPGSPSPGESSEGDPPRDEPQNPTDRASQRLRAAQQQMQEARKELDEAKRQGASERQRDALQKLEEAKAELERVLRQLREEELERTLTQLAARFRKMLEWQNVVYEETVRLDRVPQAQRDHDDEIESARLSRQEAQIVYEADKALLLLREDGSSVAFPEAVKQMRDDMQQVVERLAIVKVDAITQGLEQDILAALEETIAALEKAIQDLEKSRTPPGQSPAAGQPTEPQLVDKLAELKMIRSLQMRIYQRTQRYGEMIGGEQAETAELLDALENLAERQQRVHQATDDLRQQRND